MTNFSCGWWSTYQPHKIEKENLDCDIRQHFGWINLASTFKCLSTFNVKNSTSCNETKGQVEHKVESLNLKHVSHEMIVDNKSHNTNEGIDLFSNGAKCYDHNWIVLPFKKCPYS